MKVLPTPFPPAAFLAISKCLRISAPPHTEIRERNKKKRHVVSPGAAPGDGRTTICTRVSGLKTLQHPSNSADATPRGDENELPPAPG